MPPLTTVSSFKSLLDRVPAKLGICPAESFEDYEKWAETRSLPELHDAPGLESDTRCRRRATIKFVRADDRHPLARDPLVADEPATAAAQHQNAAAGSTRAAAVRKPARIIQKESRAKDSHKYAASPKPTCAARVEAAVEETEMTTWRQRHIPLREIEIPEMPRLCRDFLRKYIAQKLMLEHGKIKEISCSPLLPPRPRVSPNPRCTLGVRHSWNKTLRRREWKDWRAHELLQ